MFELSDILFLPGGIGSLNELFYAIDLKRNNKLNKPIIIYNQDGFYDNLICFFDDLYSQNFFDELFSDKIQASYKVDDEEVIIKLKNIFNIDLDNINFPIIFIKNNVPVYLESLSNYSLDAFETDIDNIDIPDDNKKSVDEDVLIDFDSIKVVVNSAGEA